MARVGQWNWLRGPLGGVVRVTVVSLAFVALLVWLRGDALLSPRVFNPDEAELLADGKRAMLSLVPYRDYTTPTFLFAWPLALGLLGKLGLALTLPTAHLLSGIAYLFLVVAGWYTLSRYVHWLYALACITPAAVVLFVGKAATGHSWINTDFFSLGTELLPIALLTGALLLVHTGSPLRWHPRLAIAAFLIGSSVLAKPQVLPLALGVLVASISAVSAQEGFALADAGKEARRNLRGVATWAVVFGLVPAIAALAWLTLAHTLHEFFQEPVSFEIDYVFRRSTVATPGWEPASGGERLAAIGRAIVAVPFAYVVLLAAGNHRLGSLFFSSAWPGGRRLRGLAMLGGVTLTGLVAAFLSYPVYTHYLSFVYAGCVFASVSSCAVLGPRSPRQVSTRGAWYRTGSVIAVAAVTVSLLVGIGTVTTRAPQDRASWSAPFDPGKAVPGAATGPEWDAIRAQCPSDARVVVWGWASELYSYDDWVPASRYVNPWVLSPAAKIETYRRRMEQEISSRPPQCVVEAIGPSFFGEYGPDKSIVRLLPGIAGVLARCYTARIAEPFPRTALRYYVLRDACGASATPG